MTRVAFTAIALSAGAALVLWAVWYRLCAQVTRAVALP